MADFSTTAELELEISNRELRDARSQIEQELGEIEVGVSAGGGGGGRQQGQLAGILDANRQQYELAVRRNELLEDIEAGVESGGGGGLLATGAMGGIGTSGMLAGGVATVGTAGIGALLVSLFGEGGPVGEGRPTQPGATTPRDTNVRLQYPENWPPTLELPQAEPPELGLPGDVPALNPPDMSSVNWPSYPNLSTQVDWPPLPQLPQFDVQRPEPPRRGDTASDTQVTVNQGDTNVNLSVRIGDIVDQVIDRIEPATQDDLEDLRSSLQRRLRSGF